MRKIIEKMLCRNVNLSEHCSFRIGGITHLFSEPASSKELLEVLSVCQERGLRPIITGYGTNILFPDNPQEEYCFISLKKYIGISCNRQQQSNIFSVLSGTPLSLLAVTGSMIGIDLDFTYLLPGSIGGAVYMNARYMEREMSDIISRIHYIDLHNIDAGIQSIASTEAEFDYKQSLFQKRDYIITGVSICIDTDFSESYNTDIQEIISYISDNGSYLADIKIFNRYIRELQARVLKKQANSVSPYRTFREIEKHRDKYKHFDYYSAGSVFKNNRELGKPIGQIIDELKLKGLISGGAQISPYHGNIIINRDSAKAYDVRKLIDIITESVFKECCFEPELELRII